MSGRVWLPHLRARSGADVFVGRLAKALAHAGYEPIVQTFEHHYQYAPWLLTACRQPVATDIVVANSWNAFAFKRCGVPLVVYVHHCVAHHGYPDWKSWPQAVFHNALVSRFERASFDKGDAIVAVSNSTRRDLTNDYDLRSVKVIGNWVDTARFCPVQASTQSEGRRARVLILGNMSRRKGGDLIAPFCEALGTQFTVTVVAGLRGKAPSISARGAELRFVSGLSESELIETYQATDIVACLSRHEGFGYTALEGMACAKPVVAFDVPGLRDVIKHGETGFLSPRENIVDMAERCRSLINSASLAGQFGAAGRQRAINVFGEKQAVDAYSSLFNELGVG